MYSSMVPLHSARVYSIATGRIWLAVGPLQGHLYATLFPRQPCLTSTMTFEA